MKKLPNINNLIFDLGGVLLNIDFDRTFEAFERLGIDGAYGLNDHPEVLQLFMDLEVGRYDEEEFLALFKGLVKLPQGDRFQGDSHREAELDQQIIAAFNALLLDYPPERIALVQELGKHYRTFLLSNTNAIHARCYNARLNEHFGIRDLDHLMEKAFYSHELGFRKPDKRIYTQALELARIKPEETLFFDDREENIEAAEAVGIRGVLVTEEFTVEDFFKTEDPRPKTQDKS